MSVSCKHKLPDMSNNIETFRNWLKKGNNTTWVVFLLFSATLFIKTMIFHWSCFQSILLSSLWNGHPGEFFRFWLGKVVPVFAVSSFVFISRKQWWTIIVSLLTDLWLIANLFYYKANTLFLSFETMKMADNMSGFWSSLLSYVGWDMALIIVLSLIYIVTLWLLRCNRTNRRLPVFFAVLLSLSIATACFVNYLYGRFFDTWGPDNSATAQVNSRMTAGEDFHYYYPFGNVYYYAKIEVCCDYNAWCDNYVKDYSIISYFPSCFVYSILDPAGEIITLTDKQKEEINPFINHSKSKDQKPKTNIVFILFESMESWPLEEVCGYKYMPYLNSLINSEHVLYCDKLVSQTKHGNSADGQMIGVTGMLPISNGATCRLYAQNNFPNYAHFYDRSAIVNPAPNMWQQSVLTFNYGFKELIEPGRDEHWNGDSTLLKEVEKYIFKNDSSFCVIGITVTSHVPFAHGSENPVNEIDGMPAIMSAYLNCLYYTDSCIAELMKKIMNSELANNTMVVISGDHTIFRSKDSELDDFASKHGLNFESGNTYTPLIVYSPQIEGNIKVTDICYQMDIFPTIINLIGCENYHWKGFGVNVLDEQARNNRKITEQEAYRISDLMIRSNYFSNYIY